MATYSSFSSFDGTSLSFLQEGDGVPVLLLHGFTSSTEGNWQRPGIWQALVDSGRTVIGLDARGHGRSDKPHSPAAYTGNAMVRDVDALLRHLELSTVDVVGYSMGAMTAYGFAAAAAAAAASGSGSARVRRLVLGGIGGDPAEWRAESHVAARRERAERMLAGVEAESPSTLTDPVARRVRRLMDERGNDLGAMAAILRARLPLGADVDPLRVRVPTLVVCGVDDVPAAPLAAALPQGRAHTLPGDHEGVVGDPEFAKAVVTFVNELD